MSRRSISLFGAESRLAESELAKVQYPAGYLDKKNKKNKDLESFIQELDKEYALQKQKALSLKMNHDWDIFSNERQEFLVTFPDLEGFKKIAVTFLEQQSIISDWTQMVLNKNVNNFENITKNLFQD